MSNFFIQLSVIVVLIIGNGVFAMYELAMISARRFYLQQKAEEGSSSAKAALELAQLPNRMLSTVQIGISLIGIFSGVFGGAELSKSVSPLIAKVPFLAAHADAVALALVTLLITYLSLVVGELVPKRLALSNPEKISVALAKPMKTLSFLASPFVSFLSASTDLGVRILGVKPKKELPVSEEEIKLLIRKGTRFGVFEAAEEDIVRSVFRFGDRDVDQIMTPHTEITWLDINTPPDEMVSVVLHSRFTQFPVAKGHLDNVKGILLSRELLAAKMEGEDIDLKKLLHMPLYIPENTSALDALEKIKSSDLLSALVIDEYGGVMGMVTLFDILESIVGEIPVSEERLDPMIVHRPDGSYLLDGLLQVDELKELLDLDELPDEERNNYQTLGGMMMSFLGEVPISGKSFIWENIRFEVVDMDGNRVDKVLVAPLEKKKTGEEEEIEEEE